MTKLATQKRTTLGILVGVVALCAWPCSGGAYPLNTATSVPLEADRVVVAEAAPLSLSEMDTLRGGFADPSGLVYRFAVDVHTMLNGIQVFTRSLVVAPLVATGQLQATATANLTPSNVPSNLSISTVGNGVGVVVTDQSGNRTTALSQTPGGAPASIILNTGSDRTITQSVNVSLTLQNMTSIMNFIHTTGQVGGMAQHAALRSLGF